MDAKSQTDTTIEARVLLVSAWFADHFSKPFSQVALVERLPRDFGQSGVDAYLRAFDALGLKAKKVNRKLSRIDPGSLPVLAFDQSDLPVIVVGLDGQQAIVLDPASGETEETDVSTASGRLKPVKILCAPKDALTSSRLSPHAVSMAPEDGHWLWSELGRHRAAWAQVLLAAFGVNLAGLALPVFVMNVFDRVIPNLAFVTLTTLALGVALALAFDMTLRLLRSAIIQRVSRRADIAVASRLFRLALSQRLLSRKGGAAGAITNLRDFELVRDFFASSTIVAAIDLVFIGLFLAVLVIFVGPIAWIPVAAIPIILVISLIAQLPIARSARRAQQMNLKRNVVLIEALSGLETVKSVGGEPVLQQEWENAVASSSRLTAQTRNWSTFTSSATIFVQQSVSVGIICWGVILVSNGTISLGALIAANILAGRILSPLANIAQTVFRANLAFSAKRAIDEFVGTEVEQRDSLRSDLKIRQGLVRLEDVGLRYPGAMAPALDGVSAEIVPGETVALLGRIGSGKSTLGKVINGIHPADTGLVLIDGHEIAQYEPAELRAGIGYLPQDPVLFTGSIHENLTLGMPHASEAEIGRALYLAGIDAFVASLPDGLSYFVGERGERLSGGQRQAIALARLLLRKPVFLFLDEPTNAMDHQTEAVVIARLKELQAEGVGMILSTHRLSLAAIADRYIVLDRGQKVMDGPRNAVMQALNAAAGQSRSEAL